MSSSLRVVSLKGQKFSVQLLKNLLPDMETALFFAKAYDYDYRDLSQLIQVLFRSDLIDELFGGAHSTELQEYLGDLDVPDEVMSLWGSLEYSDEQDVPDPEVLAYVFEAAEVVVAKSISDVAEKLSNVLDRLPGMEGQMVFHHLNQLNRTRPTIGDYRAQIGHAPVPDNLVILDVSGSMTSRTIETIADDVVALSYKANAHLAIVSSNAFHWEPGTYSTSDVLAHAEYAMTKYEQLVPLFDRDWDTVITIADYDSYGAAKHVFADRKGRVGQVLDISLVDRPTFLAECVSTIADEVRPLLVGNSYQVL